MNARERARLSLEGLSVGDCFGEQFFGEREDVVPRITARVTPKATWRYTDDTEMALSIVEILDERGAIDQDDLALRFARRMNLQRGYGKGAYEILDGVFQGRSWRSLSKGGFRGMGSFGNGAAMRVAPLGASFAEALWQTVGALGDRDTTCAIVGGILALKVGLEGIPASWRAAREAFE